MVVDVVVGLRGHWNALVYDLCPEERNHRKREKKSGVIIIHVHLPLHTYRVLLKGHSPPHHIPRVFNVDIQYCKWFWREKWSWFRDWGGGEEQNCGGDVNLCCIKKRKKIQNLCHIRIKTFIKGCMKALVMLFAESRCGRFFDPPNASQDTSGWSTKCWQDNPVIQWHETPSVIHADPAVQCPPNFMGTWPQRVYSDLTAPFQSLDSEAEPMTKSWKNLIDSESPLFWVKSVNLISNLLQSVSHHWSITTRDHHCRMQVIALG